MGQKFWDVIVMAPWAGIVIGWPGGSIYRKAADNKAILVLTEAGEARLEFRRQGVAVWIPDVEFGVS